MLKLNNISKYYHSNDVVALGLRKVNLEFKLGEFIAVTGESGSGKSTLLNVISGLDTYEDGEMYVDGEETSYFSIEEWESYRRQYIGFVFQNYNIIDSYSILENVMVALTIQGYPKEKIRDRAIELIDKVGLSTHVNHKASKLSGGQKQRAVIARALAKDCPIIVCDEPTGNLDSESSKKIMELLQEISKDKLVIVVTHNYEEVQDYATRKIRLFDGEVVEDKKIKKRQDVVESVKVDSYHMNTGNLSGIALRNLLRTPRRTIFTLVVAMFIAIIFTFSYGSFMQTSNNALNFGGFGYFTNNNERRIIVTKFDRTAFSETELETIGDISRVNHVLDHDVILDSYIFSYIEDRDYIYTDGNLINPADMLSNSDLKSGRLPESEFEVVVEDYDEYNIGDTLQLGFDRWDYYGDNNFIPDTAMEFEIVGIVKNINPNSWYKHLYFHDDFVSGDLVVDNAYNGDLYSEGVVNYQIHLDYGLPTEVWMELWNANFAIDNGLEDGEVYLSDDMLYELSYLTTGQAYEDNPNFYEGQNYTLLASTAFYDLDVDLTVKGEYNDVDTDKEYYQTIHLNETTLAQIVEIDAYQISVLVDDTYDAEKVMDDLEEMGYNTIYPTNIGDQFTEVLQLISKIGYAIQVIVLLGLIYFISYIVLRNVQNAKKKDYLIFRSIGASKKDLNKVTILELFFTVVMAFIITMILLYVNEQFDTFIPQYLKYFTVWSYVFIFFLLTLLSLLLGNRFNKKIFSNSVITSLKQE